jgi:hypothetical protein
MTKYLCHYLGSFETAPGQFHLDHWFGCGCCDLRPAQFFHSDQEFGYVRMQILGIFQGHVQVTLTT